MHRFISPNADFQKTHLTITDPKEIHHLSNVLRLKKNTQIIVFNGKGEEALSEINAINPKNISLTIISTAKKTLDSRAQLTLACAIPKKAKFENIIEKCTELGVDRIIPVITDRTEIRLSDERKEKKHARYKSVAVNAAKQCQRNVLPQVDCPMTFTEILKNLTVADAAFIPCLTGERKNLISAFNLTPEQKNVIFFIGPEGDFTPNELSAAVLAGCIPVTLGPHVLKVDTAAICAIACAKLLFENFSEQKH